MSPAALLPFLLAALQGLSPEQEKTLERAVAGRAELLGVLGASTGTAAGVFRWKENSASLDYTKIFGLGTVGTPEPMLGDVSGQWVLGGGVGFFEASEEFNGTVLEGNLSEYSGVAASFEAGVRLQLTDRLALSPTVAVLYCRTTNDFEARTPAGAAVEAAGDGGLVDWTLDTGTLAPSLEALWTEPLGDLTLSIGTRALYYRTEDLGPGGPDVRTESLMWVNRIDGDYRLPATVFGYPLHAGAQFARLDLRGDLEDTLHTRYYYSAGPRLMANVWGDLWKVRFIGLSATYFWSNVFDGWTWAFEVRFEF